MSMPACPKCGAIGTTGPKGKWRCTSEKCEDKQRESEEAARRRNDKLECPKCGKEAREWNNELRCWSCGHVVKKTKAVEKRIEEVAKNKSEAKDYKDSERAERLKREAPETWGEWFADNWLFFLILMIIAAAVAAAMAATGDSRREFFDR